MLAYPREAAVGGLFPCQACGAMISASEAYDHGDRVVCGDCHMHGGSARPAPARAGDARAGWWILGAAVVISALTFIASDGRSVSFSPLLLGVGLQHLWRTRASRK